MLNEKCMVNKDSLCIVMPAYNEEENIEAVVKAWYAKLDGKSDKSRLVVADSGSVDNTHNILVNLQKDYPKLIILSDTLKQHGPKLIAMYDYAIKNGFEYVFQTDSDGQTNPDEFDAFWETENEYDAVIGKRTVRGDGKSRAFVEKVVCLLVRIYFGVKVSDANAPFRLMKTEMLKKHLYRLDNDFNIPNIMLTVYFEYFKEKTVFKEITFKPRQGGKTSINIIKIFNIGWKALGDFKRYKNSLNKE